MKNNEKKNILDYFRASLMILSVLITTPIFGSLTLVLFPFIYPFDRQRHSLHYLCGINWARTVVLLNPWWKFKIVGKHNLAKNGHAAVYVSNHQSQGDILALFLLATRFRWLSKASVFKVPFLGWGMSAVGYVPVVRGNKKSQELCMKKCSDHIKNHTPIAFFPEGTRSKTGELGEFKTGAFRLAKTNGVPIIPITIEGCAKLLPKNSMFPQRANVTITVHHPIQTTDLSVEELVNQAREAISSKLSNAS